MGWGSIRGIQLPETWDVIMDKTNVPTFDDLFLKAQTPLEKLKEQHNALHRSLVSFQNHCHIYYLEEPSLKDCILCMLYVFASISGDLKTISFKVESEAPYITVNRNQLTHAAQNIYDAWGLFIEQIESMSEKIKPLNEKLDRYVSKAKNFPESANTLVTEQKLGLIESSRAIKYMASNLKRLLKAPKILASMLRILNNSSKTLTQLLEDLNESDFIQVIQNVGRQAYETGETSPEDIVRKYWPDDTRTKSTIVKSYNS